jgi:glycosyltransferase involved in cell wall biosynthesis
MDVSHLSRQLLQQMNSIQYNGEIVLLDDCSKELKSLEINRWLSSSHDRIKFFQNDKNLGRAKTRNKLAQLANGHHLLFLDADVELINPNFILKYTKYFYSNQVIVGGHKYTEKRPDRPYMLNWRYGSYLEVKSAQEHNKKPYEQFISMNFLIPKNVMLRLPFPENLHGWGHEDTLFGYILKENNIPVIHIENVVLHKGLSRTEEYLKKQENAIKQAIDLKEKYPFFEFRLTRFVDRIPYPLKFLLLTINGRGRSFVRFLCQIIPLASMLNFYKLLLYIHYSNNRQ